MAAMARHEGAILPEEGRAKIEARTVDKIRKIRAQKDQKNAKRKQRKSLQFTLQTAAFLLLTKKAKNLELHVAVLFFSARQSRRHCARSRKRVHRETTRNYLLAYRVH